jgi:hypothetical protein
VEQGLDELVDEFSALIDSLKVRIRDELQVAEHSLKTRTQDFLAERGKFLSNREIFSERYREELEGSLEKVKDLIERDLRDKDDEERNRLREEHRLLDEERRKKRIDAGLKEFLKEARSKMDEINALFSKICIAKIRKNEIDGATDLSSVCFSKLNKHESIEISEDCKTSPMKAIVVSDIDLEKLTTPLEWTVKIDGECSLVGVGVGSLRAAKYKKFTTLHFGECWVVWGDGMFYYDEDGSTPAHDVILRDGNVRIIYDPIKKIDGGSAGGTVRFECAGRVLEKSVGSKQDLVPVFFMGPNCSIKLV